jgi:hypothetical protein
LEEFALNGQGYDFTPVDPRFERAEVAGGVPVRYQAHWRCDDLFVSANVYWRVEPEDASIEPALESLTLQLEQACEEPLSVPTASVLLTDDRIPPTCEASELDAEFSVTVENFSASTILARTWANDQHDTIDTAVLPPSPDIDEDGSGRSGGSVTFLMDVSTTNAGLTFTTIDGSSDDAEVRFGQGGFTQDASVFISGSPIETDVSFSRCMVP